MMLAFLDCLPRTPAGVKLMRSLLDSAPPAHIYNYAARVMYDGTDFCGWQLQQRPQGKPSVQKVGRCALSPMEWRYVMHTELPSWSLACKISHCLLTLRTAGH